MLVSLGKEGNVSLHYLRHQLVELEEGILFHEWRTFVQGTLESKQYLKGRISTPNEIIRLFYVTCCSSFFGLQCFTLAEFARNAFSAL
jgi:hypothetical protein